MTLPSVPLDAGDRRPAAPAERIGRLDAGALQRLRELDPDGSAQLIPRVLGTFRKSLDRLLPQLRGARAERDVSAVRRVAHTLRSSAASIGALDLARISSQADDHLRTAPELAIDGLLDDLLAEATRVAADIDHHLGARAWP
jgi:HPt (histidine-containing phosphotransfer) domain-containing protein